MFHVKHPELFTRLQSDEHLAGDLGGIDPAFLPFLLLARVRPGTTCLVVLPEKQVADRLMNDLLALTADHLVYFVGRDLPDGLDVGRASQALRNLIQGQPGIYLTTTRELADGINKQGLARVDLNVGENYDLRWLEESLVEFGFERESFVVEPGVYALRGGVLDLFPGEAEHPVRLDFLGSTLESANQFDPGSQRSIDALQRLTVFSQTPYGEDGEDRLLDLLPDELDLFVYQPLKPPPADSAMHKALDARSWRRRTHYRADRLPGGTNLELEVQPNFQRNLDAFRARLSYLEEEQYQVFVCADSAVQGDRINVLFEDSAFRGLVLSLSSGFIDHSHRLAVLTDHQVFGRTRRRNLVPRLFPTKPVTTVAGFEENDFVVHLDYGIGKYLGVDLIPVAGVQREVLALEYQNQDRIYVPVDKMDRVHKYESSVEIPPKLTRLRTTEWEQVKLRTRKAVDNYAHELMELYAHRFSVEGNGFSPDGDLQRRMEAAFIYDETTDQLSAVADIKADMETQRVMDRLLCGDVGFGKTEVAIRAAFKAVNDSRQVGVLVPTTILAQQHFETFAERLEGLPVTVDVVSRFKNSSQIRKTLERVAGGEVDILIGTHRLLSRDVQFKRLGLLVIDEEHRFGVKHKERIKELKHSVDCLAMTATPIPRTLQMSLMGARDLSMLKTPPRERQPIETVVTEFSDRVIREAVLREVDRGGQVFFVHNRVESIGIMLERLKHMLPEIRFGLGHGQMKAAELEKVMLGFFHNAFDVLLSTTIVESGLDIPNANTIIVNRADAMGLSQLYQLRGRVGRSNRKAWAYFLAPGFRKLSMNAIKRLNALERHAHYGGGYEIAMRDLEIRGSGNIFGTEQSGHIVNIGYHLYTRILKETLERLKERRGDQKPIYPKPDLALDVLAQIPRSYIDDAAERLSFYRRLAETENPEGVDDLAAEMRERFGRLPVPVVNLLLGASVSLLGQRLAVRSISLKGKSSQGDFHRDHVEQAGAAVIKALATAIESSGQKVQIMNNQTLTFILDHGNNERPLEKLKIFLECMT